MPGPTEKEKLAEKERLAEKAKLAEKARAKKVVKLETPKKKKQVYACPECHEVWALSKGNLCPKCGTPGLESVIA